MTNEVISSLNQLPVILSCGAKTPRSFRPDGRFVLPVSLVSQAKNVLTWTKKNPLRLSYRWLDDNGERVGGEGLRTMLPTSQLEPLSPLMVEMTGMTPPAEGRYTLRVSALIEGVHWACDVPSAAHWDMTVDLAPPLAWPLELRESKAGQAIRGALAAAELARKIADRSFAVADEEADGDIADGGTTGAATPDEPVADGNMPSGGGTSSAELDDLLLIANRQEKQIGELIRVVGERDQHIDLLNRQLSERDRVDEFRAHLDEMRVAIAKMAVVQNETLHEYKEGAALAKLTTSLRQVEGAVAQMATLQGEALHEYKEGAALGELTTSLGQVQGAIAQMASLQGEALHEYKEGAALAELTTSLRQVQGAIAQIASLQSEALHEFKEGAAMVELTTSLRQLTAWSGTTSDIALILPMHDRLEQVRQVLDLMIARAGEQHAEHNAQFAHSNAQLSTLTNRQTIPLPTAKLVLVRNQFGLLAIQGDDPLAIAFYSSGNLPEPGTVAIVDQMLSEGDCFVDVGANVGIYSLIAGRRVGANGTVIAIEPTPSTQAALRTTLHVNGLNDRVTVHECALGSEEGSAALSCEATSGHNSLLAPQAADATSVVVPVNVGDVLLSGARPTLIKIDVEGWELDVLAGLGTTIRDNPDLGIIIEYSPEHVRRRGTARAQWLKALRALGLSIWLIDDARAALRPFKRAADLGDDTVNLFLAQRLPAKLANMATGS